MDSGEYFCDSRGLERASAWESVRPPSQMSSTMDSVIRQAGMARDRGPRQENAVVTALSRCGLSRLVKGPYFPI